MSMKYSEKYDYIPEPEPVEPPSDSQVVFLFWMLMYSLATLWILNFLILRCESLKAFFLGLFMPQRELRFRDYQLNLQFRQAEGKAEEQSD